MGLPSIGPLELIIVLAIALLVVGPKKLPEMGSAVGRTIREFRQSTSGLSDITDLGKTESQAAVPQGSAPRAAEATSEPPPFEPPAADIALAAEVAASDSSAIPPTEAMADPADNPV